MDREGYRKGQNIQRRKKRSFKESTYMRRVLKSFWNTFTCLFLDPCEMKVILIFQMRTPKLRWGSQSHRVIPFLSWVSLEPSVLVLPNQGAFLSQSTFISKDLLSTYYAADAVWSIRDTSMEEKKSASIVQEFATYWRQADSKQYIRDATICVKDLFACVCLCLFVQRTSRRTRVVQWLQDGWGRQGDVSLLALLCLLYSGLSYSFFQIKRKKKLNQACA